MTYKQLQAASRTCDKIMNNACAIYKEKEQQYIDEHAPLKLEKGDWINIRLQVTEESTAEDVEGWDSLSHLTLISEMEAAFGITFTLEEVTGSRNLGDLVSAVERHAAGK